MHVKDGICEMWGACMEEGPETGDEDGEMEQDNDDIALGRREDTTILS